MNIFETVKETVTVPSAALYYGLKVRGGMTNCIFHNDRTPSMKLYDDHFYCFGCGKCGDVIALVEGLFGQPPLKSAERLCADFGIVHSRGSPYTKEKPRYENPRQTEQRVFRILSDYCALLRSYRKKYAPKSDDEDLNPLFIESLTQLSECEYYCDIFISGTAEERQEFIKERTDFIAELRRRLEEADATAQGQIHPA